jgi:hypothetical protein
MSHHFDYPQNETLDISDAYCFDGASDGSGPRTVFGMNTSPTYGKPWDTSGMYELKIDTNGDYVEDITYRATFPIASDGTQYVQVEELTGAKATDRKARGKIITPRHAPVGEILELSHGIKLFAGQRLDPFRNFLPNPIATAKALATGTFPNYNALRPDSDSFANTSVRAYVLELPVEVTGSHAAHYWANTAYFDKGHSTWVQVQRAAKPNMSTFFDYAKGLAHLDYKSTLPGTTSSADRPTPRPTPPRESGAKSGTTSQRSSWPVKPTTTRPTGSAPHWLTVRGRQTSCYPMSSGLHPAGSAFGTPGMATRTARAYARTLAPIPSRWS